MSQEPEPIGEGLRKLILRFDDLAAGRESRPRLYLVGAGSLLFEGLLTRDTTDLDLVCDEVGKLFENQVLPGGLHSHRVRSGLVCMPEGWRCHSRPDLTQAPGLFDPGHLCLLPSQREGHH